MVRNDIMDRIRKKTIEAVDSVEDVINRVRQFNLQMGNTGGGKGGGKGGTWIIPSDVDIKKELNKISGAKDRLRNKHNDMKEPSDKDFCTEMLKRLDKQWETLRSFEKPAGKSAAKGGDNAPSSKTFTQNWVKDAMGNLKQRIATLEQTKSSPGGAAGQGNNRKGATANKLSPADALERYHNHHSKLEMVLRSIQNDDIRPDEVDSVRGDVRELLKDKVDGDTLSNYNWYDRLFGSAAQKARAAERSKQAANKNRDSGKGGNTGPTSGGTAPQIPVPRSANKTVAAAGPMGRHPSPSELLDDDDGPPAWDDDADAKNKDTFGETTGRSVGSLADMMKSTQMMMNAMPEAERRRLLSRKSKQTTQDEEENLSIAEKLRRGAARSSSNAEGGATQHTDAKTADEVKRQTPSPATAPQTQTPANVSAEKANTGSRANREMDEDTMRRMLEMSLYNLSHPLDTDRQRPFIPPNAVEPMECFPSEVHSVFSHRHVYENFDDSSLFFVFYYHQKNYQHHYASRELRRREYRFCKADTTWYRWKSVTSHPHHSRAATPGNTPPITSPTSAQPQQPLPQSAEQITQPPKELQRFDYQTDWSWKEVAELPKDTDFEP